ncbi:MAG: hypothetical protein V3Q69_10650 [Burkholderia sp.]
MGTNKDTHGADEFTGRCCINGARSVDVYAQRSRDQPPIKSDFRVTA